MAIPVIVQVVLVVVGVVFLFMILRGNWSGVASSCRRGSICARNDGGEVRLSAGFGNDDSEWGGKSHPTVGTTRGGRRTQTSTQPSDTVFLPTTQAVTLPENGMDDYEQFQGGFESHSNRYGSELVMKSDPTDYTKNR
jgi:hypothetical protein